jgi:hypothetical protein
MFGAIYACDGTLIEEITSLIGANMVFAALPAGEYVISAIGSSTSPPPETLSFTVTGSMTTIFNPAIALWDDSGTTRQLEACPSFVLGIYANETEAQNVLDDQVIDCALFADMSISIPGFSGSLSGTTINMEVNTPDECGPETLNGLISVNLTAGETVSISGTMNASYWVSDPEVGCPTCNPDFPSECDQFTVSVFVLDYNFDSIALDVSSSSSLSQSASTSFTAPYTGKYYFGVGGGRGASEWLYCCLQSVEITGSITAATISVNPIKVSYDVGLTCPALLDC